MRTLDRRATLKTAAAGLDRAESGAVAAKKRRDDAASRAGRQEARAEFGCEGRAPLQPDAGAGG